MSNVSTFQANVSPNVLNISCLVPDIHRQMFKTCLNFSLLLTPKKKTEGAIIGKNPRYKKQKTKRYPYGLSRGWYNHITHTNLNCTHTLYSLGVRINKHV